MAVSGACWCVLAANYIPPAKRPKDFYPNTDFYQSFGGSAIINPFGEVVAGPSRDEETIVYADIDLKVNEMARGIINITGLYSRWDILGLQVRENEYEPLVSMESVEAGWPAAANLGTMLPTDQVQADGADSDGAESDGTQVEGDVAGGE